MKSTVKMSESSSLFSSSLSLANSILGAGIVSLPFALSKLGYVYGTFIFVVVALYSLASLDFLTRAVITTGKQSFKSLAEHLFGSTAGPLTSALVGTFSFGFLVAYCNLLTDITHSFLSPFINVPKLFLAIVLSYSILFPLCLLKSLHSLRYASASTVVVIAYLTFSVVVSSFSYSDPTIIVRPAIFDTQSVAALGTVGFAFACHFLTPNIFRELPAQSRNRKGMFTVCVSGIGTASFFYFIVAYTGYFTYGNSVEPSILNSLPDSVLVNSARLLMALVMICSFPVVYAAVREAIIDIILHFHHAHSDPNDDHSSIKKMVTHMRLI
ncbi:hypothetical protein GEMRC1_004789 [Eukaryota sp. GEM-RC1]